MCRDDSFRLLFIKALLKELVANEGENLPCKSAKPCETQKTHRSITPEQQINPVQIPHPSKATFKLPASRAQCTVKCPGYAWGVAV